MARVEGSSDRCDGRRGASSYSIAGGIGEYEVLFLAVGEEFIVERAVKFRPEHRVLPVQMYSMPTFVIPLSPFV